METLAAEAQALCKAEDNAAAGLLIAEALAQEALHDTYTVAAANLQLIAALLAIKRDQARAPGDCRATHHAWQTTVQQIDNTLPLILKAKTLRAEQIASLSRSAALVGLQREEEALAGLQRGREMTLNLPNISAQMQISNCLARLHLRRGGLNAAALELGNAIEAGEPAQARSQRVKTSGQ